MEVGRGEKDMEIDALTLLKELVRIRSVNPFEYFHCPEAPGGFAGRGCEFQMQGVLEELLRAAGFEVQRQYLHGDVSVSRQDGTTEVLPARWNVLAKRLPRGNWNGRSILFFGHTDTVDVKAGWKSDPFEIEERVVGSHRFWFGLGANDMKAGLAAILDAVSKSVTSSYAIKVAFLADEEFYSFGAEVLRQSTFLDDVELAIAPEIGETPFDLGTYKVSDQWMGLGRTGRVEYQFDVTGKACHGSDAFVRADAVNAVHESARLQVALAADCEAQMRVYSTDGIECVNAAYLSFHAGGAAMLSVPDRASFVLDRTFLPDESPEREFRRLEALVEELRQQGAIDPRVSVAIRQKSRPTPPCEPYFFASSNPMVSRVVEAIQSSGYAAVFGIGRSVADENRVALRGIPTVTLGPSGAGSHTSEEWVDPASVERVVRIYRSLLESF
jgi:acetylornithine deacetylase/succinyl-diaminopimelate desuccinylase-like protein